MILRNVYSHRKCQAKEGKKSQQYSKISSFLFEKGIVMYI